jgi:NADH-quinone oxidoreductase subunit E
VTFRTTPRADNVYIACDGAACNVLGSGQLVERLFDRLGIIRKGQTSPDGKVTMEIFSGCMGACQIGPMATVNGKAYGNLTPEKVDQIVNELLK